MAAFRAASRVLAAVVFSVVTGLVSDGVGAPRKARQPAPDFALPDADGKTVRLSDFRGKLVVLDFWATWCAPCKVEIPWLIEFQEKYKDQGFSVLGVSMDKKGWPVVRDYVQQAKMNYPILLGNEQIASSYGGVEELPATFLLDREGNIVTKHIGLASKRKLENEIKKLLAAGAD